MSRISSLILLIVPLRALIITDFNLNEPIIFLSWFLALPGQFCVRPLVSSVLRAPSCCPRLIIVCSLVVVWVGCFTGPVHKCFYGGGQKPSCLMRFYHVQKLQFLVTVVVCYGRGLPKKTFVSSAVACHILLQCRSTAR